MFIRYNVFRRKKMEQIEYINKIWPHGENATEVLEMLSKDPVKRKYAFDKFLK